MEADVSVALSRTSMLLFLSKQHFTTVLREEGVDNNNVWHLVKRPKKGKLNSCTLCAQDVLQETELDGTVHVQPVGRCWWLRYNKLHLDTEDRLCAQHKSMRCQKACCNLCNSSCWQLLPFNLLSYITTVQAFEDTFKIHQITQVVFNKSIALMQHFLK